MNQPSVLLVSYHFYPSNEIGAKRPTALARFLVDKGLRVTVVSAFGGREIEPGSQVLPGIVAVPVKKPPRRFIDWAIHLKRTIHRPKTGPGLDGGATSAPPLKPMRARALLAPIRMLFFRTVGFIDDYKSWGYRAWSAAIKEGKRTPPALVISSSPPPTVMLVGTLTARRLRVPHIVDMRDPWTDMIASLRPTRRMEVALARRVERGVMRSAAAITSTGARVAQLLVRRQPNLAQKMFIVRNGFDGAVRPVVSDTGGRLAILFAGELYLNRDPFSLLNAVERLLSRPGIDATRVSLTFIGRKSEDTANSLTTWLSGKRCAAVVKFVPPQASEVVDTFANESTVLLNLAQHQPLSIPAKTFEHLAGGRENLLLCENDSESAQLVANIPGVTQVDPEDAGALDRVLSDLYERHVVQSRLRAPAEKDVAVFSRTASNEAFWRIINTITLLDVPEKSEESK